MAPFVLSLCLIDRAKKEKNCSKLCSKIAEIILPLI
jgi:hypothetical protein